MQSQKKLARRASDRCLRTARAAAWALPVMLLPVGMATAQDGEASARSGPRIDNVVVTARKVAESAQDVPVAMTAVTGELRKATVRDLRDLNGTAANVRIDADLSRTNAASVTIRGISPTRTDDNSFDAPIGIMIDGIYLGTLSGQIIENFDIERVEILRGPQGTLYGRNTVGGVVNAIRTRPTGEYGARLKFTYGRWDQHEFRSVINAPIVEGKLAAKGFFNTLQRDGYLDNTFLNNDQPKKDYSNYGLTLLATPNDWLEVLFTVERFEDDSQIGAYSTNFSFAPGVFPPTDNPADPNLAGGFLSCFLTEFFTAGAAQNVPCRTSVDVPFNETRTNFPNTASVNTTAYTLDMKAALSDALNLVAVMGYRATQEDRKVDFDGTEVDHITLDRKNDYEQFSGELRLEGNWDSDMGPINALLGYYYWLSDFNQKWVTAGDFGTFTNGIGGYSFGTNQWLNPAAQALHPGFTPVGACLAERLGNLRCDSAAGDVAYGPKHVGKLFEDQKTTSHAIFANANWEFMEGWIVEAGVRWTYEKKHFIAAQAYRTPASRVDIDTFPEFADLTNSWNDVSPKASISWKPTEDALVYFSYSEGWHSGGFFGVNQNIADFLRDQYDPETSQALELGLKAQWFDNRLQTNIALFRNKFENKQEAAIQFDESTNSVATVFSNVANVIYQGIELEVIAALSESLEVFGSVGYLDAQYKDFFTDVNPNDTCTGLPICIVDATFLKPRNAPKITAGFGGTYTVLIGPGELQIYAKYSYISSVEASLLNQTVSRISPRDDLSASVSYSWNNYQVTVFGRNLTNERNEVPIIIQPLWGTGSVGPGWSWGIEVTGEF